METAHARHSQPLRAGYGCHHDSCRREQRPTSGVEIVAIVIVRQQDGVDRREVGRGDRGSGHLARRRTPAEGVSSAGVVEHRVSEQRPPLVLDQHGRPADVSNPNSGHAVLGTDRLVAQASACSVAHVSA
jgi:hypothetical protein